ncbi:Ankyrin repeat domain containing protein [Coccidioides posadasii C735 delta SOWgp]|uniref:Ankyrin repeat domain containing protein n=1 Tax=Coccidioides posadasii (strain C735) TaxID=222929 RepID=C5PEV9_COCP7|nr:Ankyrin repeat domain containing protein [Coccidioides posadasii C735 delta SOWgp]EER23177.1 Ankyrin repeat domain containing protein [Coccidioides posadasii C735 delta SOWgp]|eukprot:XP_003065322.1 Ankyrin repeat domain containing protein [Coccidioides posadasii C735 delta SOWgp]
MAAENAPPIELLNMPNELLYQIAENIERDCDLNSFLQTCRELHELLNPQLYRRHAKSSNHPAIWWALDKGNVETVKLALDYGSNVDYVRQVSMFIKEILFQGGIFPRDMEYARRNLERRGRTMEIIGLIFEHCVRADAYANKHRHTTIESAVMGNDTDSAKFLLENGERIPAVGSVYGNLAHTLIQWPGERVNLSMLDLLFKHGLHANVKNASGMTALHMLVEQRTKQGLEDVARMLLRYGTDIDARANNGKTALEVSVEGGSDTIGEHRPYYYNEEVVRLLLENGADTSRIALPESGPLRDLVDKIFKETGRTFEFRT